MQRDFHHGLRATLRLKPTSETQRTVASRNFFHRPATRGLDISNARPRT